MLLRPDIPPPREQALTSRIAHLDTRLPTAPWPGMASPRGSVAILAVAMRMVWGGSRRDCVRRGESSSGDPPVGGRPFEPAYALQQFLCFYGG
ncbi:hypothetical protein GCM10023084_29200 [Streptomyces lacrimifluminis]|uniref:Uncharacterized protein n=1 Tax=Streptomyces lacrimifluminis TaxID=1500077 RepID=A0A917NTW2_9ACTN|nr:hypothetical protein GCM10012282_25830 [Streptomyces lacrimifluminis]